MSKFLSLIKAMGFGTAADAAVHVGISTDTQPRLQIDAGGKHTWGAGSTTPGDTTLYRSAADTLKTDDAFIATGGLTVKTTEIDTASATSGQALVFNGTKFAPGVPTSGTLDGLTDVVISTSTTGQVLKYDGTNWVNATLVSGVSVSDAAPSSPNQGELWFESDTGLTYIYYDSFWVEVGAGSSYDPITNTIQSKGDLIVGTASQALSRQAVGTDSQRLIANSSTTTGISWANDSTNTVIDTKGDLLVGATNDVVAKLPVGTNNQMLVADTTATNGISWQSRPWNLPWGVAGDTGATAATAFVAGTPLTVLTLPTTIYAGRKYQIFGKLAAQYTTSATVGAALFVTGNSINRSLYYQTAAVSQFFCLGVNGFTTYTATELGVTSGSSSVSITLKFKSGGAGSLNTDPDGFVSAGSFSQQLTVIDIGPA